MLLITRHIFKIHQTCNQQHNIMTRNQNQYKNLGHSLIENHLKRAIEKKMPYKDNASKVNKITDFITTTLNPWLGYYLKNRFGSKAPYLTYSEFNSGIHHFSSNKECVIAIAGDWATDTNESREIAHSMAKHRPDYTIHMGDTYFVGDPAEIKANFLNNDNPWVKGSKGSFALLGNHEMYARGISYFNDLLPSLGTKNSAGKYEGQHASFFCLENDYWRILGLDTGYHSIGMFPVLEMLRMFTPNARLHNKAVKWLDEVVKLSEDKRGLIILTHHPCVTAFKKQIEYLKPASQLSGLLKKETKVLWLCGHEHKFSMYSKKKVANNLWAYVRSVGNGGMPIELNSEAFKPDAGKKSYENLVVFDNRQDKSNTNLFGFNGYTVLKLKANNLFLEYHDKNRRLITEHWTNNQGSLSGTISCDDKELTTLENKALEDVVK
jgi:hypothetical protein